MVEDGHLANHTTDNYFRVVNLSFHQLHQQAQRSRDREASTPREDAAPESPHAEAEVEAGACRPASESACARTD